jgi:NAD(P)-dependent dehydrogenase (short-subunit alcohol dehydrogenase family)
LAKFITILPSGTPAAEQELEMTRIALVTGASRGLGRNTAQSIARHGGDVIITYRSNEAEARSVVEQIEALGRRAFALQLDVGHVSAIAAFVDQVRAVLKSWGRESFDHLVNNAGHGEMASFAETTEAQFDRLFDVTSGACSFSLGHCCR